MVVVVAPHRPDHAHVVGHARHVRQQFRELQPALPMLAESKWRLHHDVFFTARLKTLDVVRVFLPVPLGQCGFRVEQVHLARPAVLQQHDDRLGPRRKMCVAQPRATLPRSTGSSQQPIGVQQVCQGRGSQPQPGLAQQGPSADGFVIRHRAIHWC